MKKKIINTILISLFLMFYYSCKTTKPVIDNKTNENIPIGISQDSSRLSSYKGDTIGYINYLYKNQAKYTGKPLSILLKDLDLKIYQFGYNGPNKRDGKIYSLRLISRPYGEKIRTDKNNNDQDIELGIGLQTYVLQDSIISIIKTDGYPYLKWSKKTEDYFGKQIVGNLWLMDYINRSK